MDPQLYQTGTSIVLVGSFSPEIFHPLWFARNDLIRMKEGERAKIDVIHPQLTNFSSEWLQVHVTTSRFQISTIQDAFTEPLRDLALAVLQLFPAVPLRALGINRDAHYRFDSIAARDNLAFKLMSREPLAKLVAKPALLKLIVQSDREDEERGYMRTIVEPSPLVDIGVFINVNDHYENLLLPGERETVEVTDPIDGRRIISAHWAESLQRSNRIAEGIIAIGDQPAN